MKNREFEIAEFQLIKKRDNEEDKITNYGIEVDNVREVIRLPDLTEYPKKSEYIIGVFTSRDEITPLIHLSKWLGLSSCSVTDEKFVIVTEIEKETNGFLIDSISRIHRVSSDNIEKIDKLSVSEKNDFFLGAVRSEGNLIFILDFEKIMFDINNEEEAY